MDSSWVVHGQLRACAALPLPLRFPVAKGGRRVVQARIEDWWPKGEGGLYRRALRTKHLAEWCRCRLGSKSAPRCRRPPTVVHHAIFNPPP
eukprot:1815-Chlamydomonas_euryale.AAC.1